MSFKRFVGNTSKEAMAQARRALGDEAVILSNKRLPGGQIEILAAASDAVEAIVEDARRPKPAAPRKGAPPVETFQDYLRRQAPPPQSTPATQRSSARPATINVPLEPPARTAAAGSAANNAALYRAVEAAPHDDDAIDDFSGFEELGWADSRFDPSLMPAQTNVRPLPTRGAQATGNGFTGSARLAAAPTWDTHLPNDARAAAPARAGANASRNASAMARPETVSMPLPEPAVFRRRPSRESAALQPQAIAPVVGSMSDAFAAPMPAYAPQPLALQPQVQPQMPPPPLQAAVHAQPPAPQYAPQPQIQPQHVEPPVVAMPVAAPQAVAMPAAAPVQAATPAAQAVAPFTTAPAAAAQAAIAPVAAPVVEAPAIAAPAGISPAAIAPVAVAPLAQAAPLPPATSPTTEIRLPAVDTAAQASAQLMAELHSLRSALQEQLHALSNTVTASDASRRHPAQARLMTRLLTAGFSADVARRIALNAPVEADAATADGWLQDVLALNLRCAQAGDSIVERAGQGGCNVYALVGPTGVGKTTTVAKLAARFAVKYGTQALGLVTLDGYRVAAHEQLRTYGRILGAPVHLAQDGATLRELLASMQNKKLVLIDTCGVGPRDERLPEMLNTLALAGSGERKVQPVLLLNAASHAETLDDNARAWRAGEAAGTILTKLDEAARIGGALDCALRWKLTLLGLTNGQRVPEDLHLPNARLLAHLALKPAHQLFALAEAEGALMAQAARGAVHA